MNTIMVIVLKVLFPYGLSLCYIMIHSIIFLNGPTNSVTQVKESYSRAAFPLFRLGGGWGVTGLLAGLTLLIT